MSYLNSSTTGTRVAYAKKCLLSGYTNGRAFDDCFENGDGDAVYAILLNAAQDNMQLQIAMKKNFNVEHSAEQAKRFLHKPNHIIYAMARAENTRV